MRTSLGQRKGRPVKPPKFKTRKSKQTARFRKGGFKVGQHKVYLTKVGKLKIVWSRKLPSEPSSVTVIKDCRGDSRIAPTQIFSEFFSRNLCQNLTSN